jgi:hypothetical protein
VTKTEYSEKEKIIQFQKSRDQLRLRSYCAFSRRAYYIKEKGNYHHYLVEPRRYRSSSATLKARVSASECHWNGDSMSHQKGPIKFRGFSIELLSIFRRRSDSSKNQLNRFFEVSTIPGRQRNVSHIHTLSLILRWISILILTGPMWIPVRSRPRAGIRFNWFSENPQILALRTDFDWVETMGDYGRSASRLYVCVDCLVALSGHCNEGTYYCYLQFSAFPRKTADRRDSLGDIWCYPLNSSALKYPNHPTEYLH